MSPEEFDLLCERYLSGRLTWEEGLSLREALRDPEWQERWRDNSDMEGMLADEFTAAPAPSTNSPGRLASPASPGDNYPSAGGADAMKDPITIEGSEEDIGRLLVQRGLLRRQEVDALLAERRSLEATAAIPPALGDMLVEKKLLSSALVLQALRVKSKASAQCEQCSTPYTIYYHWPGSTYTCTQCQGRLVTTAAAPEPSVFGPPPSAVPPSPPPPPAAPAEPAKVEPPPPADEVVLHSADSADQTMLDMGMVARRPAPAPAAPPPAEDEVVLNTPDEAPPAPAAPPPLPAEEAVISAPDVGGETMLDMGGLVKPPAAKAPTPAPAAPSIEEDVELPAADAEPAPEPAKAPAAGPLEDVELPAADAEPAPAPALSDTSKTASTTQSGGVDSPTKVEPTIMLGDLAEAKNMPGTGYETSSGQIEPTIQMDATGKPIDPSTGKIDPTILTDTSRSKSDSALKSDSTRSKSDTGLPHDTSRSRSRTHQTTSASGLPDVTPRTGSGGQRGYMPTKAAPKEVQEAAKDIQRVFGKYILVKELGRGGAGVVYKAWDTTLAQFVALKFIRDQDLSDTSNSTGSQQIEDFQREARMSAKLRHANIIRIYELGSMSNRYYLAMDYIEGGSLFEVIHGGKERNTDTTFNTDATKYLTIMRQICEAVDHAHKHDPPVIHRDIKPHNVLVDKKGFPYVVDFGLAKEVDISTSQATMTGVVKGTPSYMAPEQAEGRNKDVDARTDIYSLGAILYEMIVGRPPFIGESVRQVLNKICSELPERPNEAIAKAIQEKPEGANRPKPVPKPLETICLKALEKAKEDRYQTGKDLADDIGRFLNDEDIMAQEPGLYRRVRRKLRQHPILTAAAGMLIVFGAAFGAYVHFRPEVKSNPLEPLLAIATADLENKKWAQLQADASNIRKHDAKHPMIKQLEDAFAEHEADLQRRRDQWKAGLERLAKDPVPAVLNDLRTPFKEAKEIEELKKDFRDELESALFRTQTDTIEAARSLYGGGPDPKWLLGEVKPSAKNHRQRLADIQAVASDADFSAVFKPNTALGEDVKMMDKILAYEGLWDIRVNVIPFAYVTIKKGNDAMPSEWTPFGKHQLEVGQGYQIELAWPSKEKPTKVITKDIKDLKHGRTVTVEGDITKADVTVR